MPLDSFKLSKADCASSRSLTPTHHTSLSMEQALNSTVHQLQPSRTSCRVKDMGREYLQQNETCQWIQFMTEDAPDFYDRRDRRTRQIATKKKVIATRGDYNILEHNSVRPEETVKPQEALPEVETKQAESLSQKVQELEVPPVSNEVKPDANQECLKSSPAEPNSALSPKVETVEIVPKQIVEPVHDRKDAPSILRGKCRRLKGCLANNCALRDEGTVGSLIYQREDAAHPNDQDPSPHGHHKQLRNVRDGDHHASPRHDRDESFDWSEVASPV